MSKETLVFLCAALAASLPSGPLHATEWAVECFSNKQSFAGNPWEIFEVDAETGDCVYTKQVRDEEGKLVLGEDGFPETTETGRIEPATLAETRERLRMASESLEAGNFGEPIVPPTGDKPVARVMPGNYLCFNSSNCDPEDQVWGQYTENAVGDKELFLAKDHLDSGTNTAHHEVFHSIEPHFAGYKNGKPARWIEEGMAEGFAQTSARRHGLPFDRDAHKRPFTRSLDLRGSSDAVQDDLSYGTGEFWDFVGREFSTSDDYGFAKELMSQPSLGSIGYGLPPIDEGLKTLGISGGLAEAYARFVTKHLNVERTESDGEAPDLGAVVEMSVVDSDKTTREVSFATIPPLASNGLILKVEGKEGQEVEVAIRFKDSTGLQNTYLAVDTRLEEDEFYGRHKLCGEVDPIQYVVRIANVDYVYADKPTLEIEARVVDDDVCSCNLERLSIAGEVIEHAESQRKTPQAYARVDIGGERIVIADDSEKGSAFYVTSVKVGERRHMGRKQYENFSRTKGEILNMGLSSRAFRFTSPGEGPGTFQCRPRTPGEKRPLFAPPDPLVDHCRLSVNDLRRGVQFIAVRGDLNITQWDRDCWIEGRFALFDEDDRRADGVFAIDAGRSGIYDSRTKTTYRGERYKALAEVIDEGTFGRIEELKRRREKAGPTPSGSPPGEAPEGPEPDSEAAESGESSPASSPPGG